MIVYPDLALILGLVVYGFVYGLSLTYLNLRRPLWVVCLCVFLSALSSAFSVLPYIPGIAVLLFGVAVTAFLTRGKTFKGTFLNVVTVLCILILYLGLWGVVSLIFFSLSTLCEQGGVYFLLPFWEGLMGAFLAGGSVFLFLRSRKRRAASFSPVDCAICWDGLMVPLRCYPDSGNFLTDPVSGVPVVIVEYDSLRRRVVPSLPPPMTYEFATRFGSRARVIPYRSVSECGQMLSAFVPDDFLVEGTSRKAVVAVTVRPLDLRGRFSGIIGPDLWKGE